MLLVHVQQNGDIPSTKELRVMSARIVLISGNGDTLKLCLHSAHYRFCKAMMFISIFSIRVLNDLYSNRIKSTVPLTSAGVDAVVW